MPQIGLLTQNRHDLREEVDYLEKMIVSAGHLTTGLETQLDEENAKFAVRVRRELQSLWEILLDAEITLLKVQSRMAEDEIR